MSLMELRVFAEIINHNHAKYPDQLIYTVPYEYIFNFDDTKNRNSNANRIAKKLQTRYIFLDQQFYLEHFKENAVESFNPFPSIKHRPGENHFHVRIDVTLKKILALTSIGYTKGDIYLLRRLQHEASHHFYWLIRREQAFKYIWTIELEELKRLLSLENKYKLYSNFKVKVLEIVRKEFIGEWVEFEYKAIKKGKGGGVHSIQFTFKKGPKEEKEAPVGQGYPWEEKLVSMGVDPEGVKMIRAKARSGILDEKSQVLWNENYVRFSIEAIQQELKIKQADPKRKPIANIGGWIYAGLQNGQWNNHVAERRERIKNEIQMSLPLVVGEVDKEIPSPSMSDFNQVSFAASLDKQRIVLSPDDVQEYDQLYTVIHPEGMSFAFWMEQKNSCVKEGKTWVKYW